MKRFAIAFWAIVIAIAAVPIVAGIVRVARTPRPAMPAAVATRAPAVRALVLPPDRAPDATSQGDVVVDRSPSPNADGSARVALVVAPLGASAAVDGAFVRLPLPIAVAIDPALPQAAADTALAGQMGRPVYAYARAVPSAATLANWRARFPNLAGVAAIASAGMPRALRDQGLAFLDLRGDADAAAFAAAGVPLLRRDITLDDRDESGYVRYMLDRAIALGAERGTAVAWLHPRAASLAALRTFAGSRARDVVPLDQNSVRVGGSP